MSEEVCPLCFGDSNLFALVEHKRYFECEDCKGVFLPKSFHLDSDCELKRYKMHNNDVDDIRYQNFVSDLISLVKNSFNQTHKGLDFGCGNGPVITKLLREDNYALWLYDPYFYPDVEALEKRYDYIICCEVIEHFSNPNIEFKRLKKMLNKGGKIFAKTSFFDENIKFEKWYYKDDPTHIFFYSEPTLQKISEVAGFSSFKKFEKIVVFENM